MPILSRRPGHDPHRETWRIFYDDVCVGTIGERVGIPAGVHRWGWSCGFYPGCKPGEHVTGSAVDFDRARTQFDEAWRVLLANRTEADFQAWRDHQTWTLEKYRRFDRGERMPSDWRPDA
jgi:hypothetical protein